MKDKTSKKLIFLIIVFIFLVSSSFSYLSAQNESVMYVHCINVGQGDATLLEFPCGALLIDTGAQDNDFVTELIDYLNDFFNRRTDLDRTLESVFITHNHPDHVKGLKEVLNNFTVEGLIYNGRANTEGTGDLCWALRHEDEFDFELQSVTFEQVTANNNRNGFTNSLIDPIECENCDPKIVLLSGGFEENPGWTVREYANKNNHSLVIRIDFGESSFLFTGDLELEAIKKVLEYYDSEDTNESSLLDIDVYRIGHHGSNNATPLDLVEAMTPQIAIFSVGIWDFGRETGNPFSTFAYGHPRKDVIKFLETSIKGYRSGPIKVRVATGGRAFTDYRILRKIYASAWDNNIKIKASLDGTYRITRNN